MASPCPSELVLWTGPRHAGKTTAAGGLADRAAQRGHSVAGLLAPSIYDSGVLVGFDAVDLHTAARCPLARRGQRGDQRGDQQIGRFAFSEEGLRFGRAALRRPAAAAAALVVVDEFGPRELEGSGWRPEIQRLLVQRHGLLLLVVRQELVDRVAEELAEHAPTTLAALEDASIEAVLARLANHRGSFRL